MVQSTSSMRFTTASTLLSGEPAAAIFLPRMSPCFHSEGTAIWHLPLSSLMTFQPGGTCATAAVTARNADVAATTVKRAIQDPLGSVGGQPKFCQTFALVC